MQGIKAAAIVLCVTAATLLAQQHPNFSGSWSLNLGASDYSDSTANRPDHLTITVQQHGDVLKYRVEREKDSKKSNMEVDLSIGGAPLISDALGDIQAQWKGDKLEIQTMYNPGQDRQSDQVETWSLSADEKQLTDDIRIHPPNNQREVHIRRVLDKQQ